MSVSGGQSHVSKVICTICGQPIERRKNLAVLDQGMLKYVPCHFTCHADKHVASGKHWNTALLYTANSLFLKLLGPIVWIFSVYFIMASDSDSKLWLLLYMTLVVGIFSARALKAYLQYERKVPK